MCHGEFITRRKKLQPWESVMKGIKPTSYLNNMIIYTDPQPTRRNGPERSLADRRGAALPASRPGAAQAGGPVGGPRRSGFGSGRPLAHTARSRPGTVLLPAQAWPLCTTARPGEPSPLPELLGPHHPSHGRPGQFSPGSQSRCFCLWGPGVVCRAGLRGSQPHRDGAGRWLGCPRYLSGPPGWPVYNR